VFDVIDCSKVKTKFCKYWSTKHSKW